YKMMIDIKMKQISSLEKIRSNGDIEKSSDVEKVTLFQGEHYAYQIALTSDERYKMKIEIESSIKECITPYVVEDALMDNPLYAKGMDDDYITDQKGYMPDILIPAESKENIFYVNGTSSLWLDVNIPKDMQPGVYTITTKFNKLTRKEQMNMQLSITMQVTVLNREIAHQKLITTQWLHPDCIASVHNVEIYSEEHWQLIDKYIEMASDIGMNMMLTPVFSLNLDVGFGISRPNIQLVDISLGKEGYKFDFSKLRRWIALCKKNNIKYYEISHLFSQHGLKYSSNVIADMDGEENYIFGWNTKGDSQRYAEFLKIFIPKLIEVLEEEKIKDVTYFHISDEPQFTDFEQYKYAHDLIRPLIGDCKILEAISNYEFYAKGLIDVPAVCEMPLYLKGFLENKTDNLFIYHSNICNIKVANRFLSMPLYRDRALGFIMYKFGVKGFLHWGYNFYYNFGCEYTVNPYLTTSGDKHYPSGDTFSVYPGKDGPLCSMRAKVFKDALQDIQLCQMLEDHIGKEEVVKFIEDMAGMEITFEEYPRNSEFYDSLNLKIKETIAEYIK
ncbi:MAG: DUF4091 domain-containing protein, partial [Clostridia bacterium]|nr:DUF4091 domain-containing protein [Clostridia bacterium]